MATTAYNGACERAMGSDGLDVVGGDVRCMLLIATSTTPDDPTHEFVSDIVADEASDGSYARVALTTESIDRDDTNDRAEFKHDDILFANLDGGQILFAVLFNYNASDTAATLISCHDIADTTPNGNNFTLTVGAEGSVHVAV